MNTKTPSFIRSGYLLCRSIADRVSKDCVFAYAGQASFFIVISAIPFFLLLTSALRLILPQNAGMDADFFGHFLPESAFLLLKEVFEALKSEANVSLLSISGIALLWASSRGIRALSEGIRNVFGTRDSISYFHKYLQSIFTTIFVMAVMIASVAVMLFRDHLFENILGMAGGTMRVLVGMRFLIFLSLLTVVFSALFSFMSGKQIPFRQHMTGALFAALGWIVFSWGYSIYVNEFAGESYLYGSLSAVVLLMLWVYFCMSILLFGAEISAWLNQVQSR